jgi:hypothetical protein
VLPLGRDVSLEEPCTVPAIDQEQLDGPVRKLIQTRHVELVADVLPVTGLVTTSRLPELRCDLLTDESRSIVTSGQGQGRPWKQKSAAGGGRRRGPPDL